MMKLFRFELGLELFFQVAAQTGTLPSAPEVRWNSHHASLVIKAVRDAKGQNGVSTNPQSVPPENRQSSFKGF